MGGAQAVVTKDKLHVRRALHRPPRAGLRDEQLEYLSRRLLVHVRGEVVPVLAEAVREAIGEHGDLGAHIILQAAQRGQQRRDG